MNDSHGASKRGSGGGDWGGEKGGGARNAVLQRGAVCFELQLRDACRDVPGSWECFGLKPDLGVALCHRPLAPLDSACAATLRTSSSSKPSVSRPTASPLLFSPALMLLVRWKHWRNCRYPGSSLRGRGTRLSTAR